MSDGFLSRWSRLKAESKAEAPSPAGTEAEATPPEQPPPQDQPPPDLPPIESLTKDSDFSPFLRAGIPEDLRKAALSRLWASDPLFSKPEIYDLHMEDYTQPAVAEMVKTAWNFGKEVAEHVGKSADFTKDPENTQNAAQEGSESDPTA